MLKRAQVGGSAMNRPGLSVLMIDIFLADGVRSFRYGKRAGVVDGPRGGSEVRVKACRVDETWVIVRRRDEVLRACDRSVKGLPQFLCLAVQPARTDPVGPGKVNSARGDRELKDGWTGSGAPWGIVEDVVPHIDRNLRGIQLEHIGAPSVG